MSNPTSQSDPITAVLAERGKTHGDFTENAAVAQLLKSTMRSGRNWNQLLHHQREAIDMICHKLGRISAGDPNEPDHWQDIAGYATLVVKRLQ